MVRLAVLIAVLLLLLGVYPGVLLLRSTLPEVRLEPAPKAIGRLTPLKMRIVSRHGFRSAIVWLEQGGGREKVFEASRPARRWRWAGAEAPQELSFTAVSKRDGKGRLVVEVVSNDLRGATGTAAYDVETISTPPGVVTAGAPSSVRTGGSGLVVFTPSGYWSEAGVRAGKYTSRSFPKPGSTTEQFSLFAFPWDVPRGEHPVVFVRNPAGAEATARVPATVIHKSFRRRNIKIDDRFLDRVLADIDPSGTGDRVERFLRINRDMRRENNQLLADLRLKTAGKFLWTGPFLQMARSMVESQFADVRTYVYQGRKIDEQVHLGFDLSSTKNTPVPASNDGVVLYAARLGIYGNCIVLDHGFGLQSIYGHLSSIGVKVGDSVKKGQEMGESGSTGLAGGDHLHFSMQVDGVQVNPMEWWDEHWVNTLIANRMR